MGAAETLVRLAPAGELTQISFQEGGSSWQKVPVWARFMLDVGWNWAGTQGDRRRVGLITTPCDSASAGLIGLGAICRRLREDDANDLDSHFRRLAKVASRPGADVVLRMEGKRGRFVPDGELEPGMIWVRELDSKRCTRRTVTRGTAGSWWVEGEAPVAILDRTPLEGEVFYNGLFPSELAIRKENLRMSDSVICLAGPAGGQKKAQRSFSAIRFGITDRETDLAAILSVQEWCPGSVSRISYFNSLTETFDRQVSDTRLVIADGSGAFLTVLAREEFRQANVLAVVPRTVDRDALVATSEGLSNLLQWYEAAKEPNMPQPVPAGVTLAVIEKR